MKRRQSKRSDQSTLDSFLRGDNINKENCKINVECSVFCMKLKKKQLYSGQSSAIENVSNEIIEETHDRTIATGSSKYHFIIVI